MISVVTVIVGPELAKLEGLNNVVSIAAGGHHSYAITADGKHSGQMTVSSPHWRRGFSAVSIIGVLLPRYNMSVETVKRKRERDHTPPPPLPTVHG